MHHTQDAAKLQRKHARMPHFYAESRVVLMYAGPGIAWQVAPFPSPTAGIPDMQSCICMADWRIR
jgi:hypothetical protein